ncbi:MAG: serpin family protein [Prevotella sp.]|jgi:serpin B|nr:serpin family protein [Prevotella sp.]
MKTNNSHILSYPILAGTIIIALGISSCESASDDNTPTKLPEPLIIELTASEANLTATANEFALKFFATVSENTEANVENVVLSPFSLSMDLGMALNGAAGRTREAILETIGLESYANEEVNVYFRKIWEALYKTDPSTAIAIANSVWYNKAKFTIKPEFVATCQTWYDAVVKGMDYSLPSTITAINDWCEDNTRGLIKKFIENQSDLYDVNLLNALYFKGIWAEGFKFDGKKTATRSFRKENGQTANVKMMFNEADRRYYADEYLEYTVQPYGNKAYSMGIVLPKENVPVNDVIAQLRTAGYWAKINEESYLCRVELGLPRFKVEYSNKKLRDVLVQMGMGIACSELAEFPDIAIDVNFYIANVTQKTYIKVNEEGTEAAAVTSVGTAVTSVLPSIQFYADRPFLFVIQENSTGTVLFIGKIGNPQE